jgi:puromycin-sensitive aminopeptidase
VREIPLPETGKKEVVFADTIKMSTYLVAFIVGEFDATEPVMVGSAAACLGRAGKSRWRTSAGRSVSVARIFQPLLWHSLSWR